MPASETRLASLANLIVAACVLLIVGTPWYLSVATARSSAKRMPVESSLALPPGRGSWQGPRDAADSWRPMFTGAAIERATTYVDRIRPPRRPVRRTSTSSADPATPR